LRLQVYADIVLSHSERGESYYGVFVAEDDNLVRVREELDAAMDRAMR